MCGHFYPDFDKEDKEDEQYTLDEEDNLEKYLCAGKLDAAKLSLCH